MPGFDKTGPFGNGPVGRGLGPCDSDLAGTGKGRRFWRGRGGGWGRMPFEMPTVEEEKDFLERRKGWLEAQLQVITERLKGLGKTGEE